MAKGTDYIQNPILDADRVKAELEGQLLAGVGIPDWKPSTFYKVGQSVVDSGILYRATITFTSSETFPIDYASNYWIEIASGASSGSLIFGEVTTFAALPDPVANPGKRFFVNTTTGIIGFRKLNGIYRSDGAEWLYQGYDRNAESIKSRYESNSDTNVFLDAEKTKLAGIDDGAEINNISDFHATELTDGNDTTIHHHDSRYYNESELDNGQLNNLYYPKADFKDVSVGIPDAGKPVKLGGSGVINSSMLAINSDQVVEGSMHLFLTTTEKTKLLGIENNATADQSPSDIKIAYESNLNTNAFSDIEQSKLGSVENNATADQTPTEIKVDYESNADTNAFLDAEKTKLAGVEDNATIDQTPAEIKVDYENNANTNAFTDAEKAKLLVLKTSYKQLYIGGISAVGSNATKGASFGHNSANGGFTCIRTGRIIGLTITINNVTSGGVCEVQSLINGVAQTMVGQVAEINTGANPVSNFIEFGTPIEFVAGDILSMQTVTVGYSPIGADATLTMIVEQD